MNRGLTSPPPPPQDKQKCSCWQQTIQGTEFGPSGQVDYTAGYHYRRLINGNVITGIYECNDRYGVRFQEYQSAKETDVRDDRFWLVTRYCEADQ